MYAKFVRGQGLFRSPLGPVHTAEMAATGASFFEF